MIMRGAVRRMPEDFVQVNGVCRFSYILSVFDYFHSVILVAFCFWG